MRGRLDVIVVIVYPIGIFALAQWASRDRAGAEQKSSGDYFMA